MDTNLATAMRRALEQTRAGRPADATRLLQAALGGLAQATPASAGSGQPAGARWARLAGPAVPSANPGAATMPPPDAAGARISRSAAVLPRMGAIPATARAWPGRGRASPAPIIPPGARYEIRTFRCDQGARDYRLYVPALLPRGPQGLVVMLHGCTQTPDDFAVGTGMNELAERHGLIVIYPGQPPAHNTAGCWNWFRPGDQARGAGEPALLAALARAVAAEFSVNSSAMFAAGLSAGGAMAAVLGAAYPDVFSAVGVHSGLPCGAARDVVSAFAAMRGEGAGGAGRAQPSPMRTIVFHGTADGTVHPANAGWIVAAADPGHDSAPRSHVGIAPGGRRFTVKATPGQNGATATELWLVEGGGHAWFGGDSRGSYTDPTGPDASAQMVRFFLGHSFDAKSTL